MPITAPLIGADTGETASIGPLRDGFGMSWPRTLYRGWLVVRANQAWGP